MELERVHLCGVFRAGGLYHGDELVVKRIGLALCGQSAAEVLLDHGGGAGDEVAEVVCKVGVDGADEQLVGEVAVGAEGEGAQQEEAQRVHAEHIRQQVWVNDVALGFGHLAAVDNEPAVAVYLLRQRHLHAHEHGRPDYRVEADYLLADDVHVGRPVLVVIVVLIVQEAERGAVVEQRVDPDVHDVARVKVHGDTPCEAGAGDAEVFKAGLDEVVNHLVDAGRRLKESAALEQLLHGLCVLGEAEEVGFLLGVVHLAAAVGAFAVDKLALGPEALTGGAVFALVGSFVDVALVVHLLEDALHGLDMIVVGGADEAVVRDVHQLPKVEDAALAGDDLVHELLRGDACGLGLLFDLLAVLVGTGEEHHVITAHALVARDGVGRHGAVGVAYVQLVGGVIDRCCDIKCFLFHGSSLLYLYDVYSQPLPLPSTIIIVGSGEGSVGLGGSVEGSVLGSVEPESDGLGDSLGSGHLISFSCRS